MILKSSIRVTYLLALWGIAPLFSADGAGQLEANFALRGMQESSSKKQQRVRRRLMNSNSNHKGSYRNLRHDQLGGRVRSNIFLHPKIEPASGQAPQQFLNQYRYEGLSDDWVPEMTPAVPVDKKVPIDKVPIDLHPEVSAKQEAMARADKGGSPKADARKGAPAGGQKGARKHELTEDRNRDFETEHVVEGLDIYNKEDESGPVIDVRASKGIRENPANPAKPDADAGSETYRQHPKGGSDPEISGLNSRVRSKGDTAGAKGGSEGREQGTKNKDKGSDPRIEDYDSADTYNMESRPGSTSADNGEGSDMEQASQQKSGDHGAPPASYGPTVEQVPQRGNGPERAGGLKDYSIYSKTKDEKERGPEAIDSEKTEATESTLEPTGESTYGTSSAADLNERGPEPMINDEGSEYQTKSDPTTEWKVDGLDLFKGETTATFTDPEMYAGGGDLEARAGSYAELGVQTLPVGLFPDPSNPALEVIPATKNGPIRRRYRTPEQNILQSETTATPKPEGENVIVLTDKEDQEEPLEKVETQETKETEEPKEPEETEEAEEESAPPQTVDSTGTEDVSVSVSLIMNPTEPTAEPTPTTKKGVKGETRKNKGETSTKKVKTKTPKEGPPAVVVHGEKTDRKGTPAKQTKANRTAIPAAFPKKPEPKWGNGEFRQAKKEKKGGLVEGPTDAVVTSVPSTLEEASDALYEWRESAGRTASLQRQKPQSFVYLPKKPQASDEAMRSTSKLTIEIVMSESAGKDASADQTMNRGPNARK